MINEIELALQKLRKIKPLTLCLTNHVTMDFMANVLLSLGAAPIMTQDLRELEELINISHAITLNIGTLDPDFMLRAKDAVRLAAHYQKPIVLDPVGAGATQIRTDSARSLMQSVKIIKGNASEIMALVENIQGTLGVESTHCVSDAEQSALQLAKTFGVTVVVSGVEDFITDGQRSEYLTYGSPLMSLVTGMGCALTAVIAAFKTICKDSFQASTLATAYFGLCGTIAAQKSDKPGSFRSHFIDQLFAADFDTMRAICHVG